MRHRLSSFTSALAALTIALTAAADGYNVVGDSTLDFNASGPAGLAIKGNADKLRVSEQGGNVVFVASVANIKTGIGMRDTHTKRYLRADKNPDVSLTVLKSALKLPDDGKTASGSVPGTFHLAGVDGHDPKNQKKPIPVTVAYTVKRTGTEYAVEGRFAVDIQNHGIEQPCYLGVCVDPVVKVHAKFNLHAK